MMILAARLTPLIPSPKLTPMRFIIVLVLSSQLASGPLAQLGNWPVRLAPPPPRPRRLTVLRRSPRAAGRGAATVRTTRFTQSR
jgi:hypothetical protein